ncbi:hypothetical protein Scep_023767 [Stephania cephalantha]|uniref:Uncharacterized protein n=1 Tax=Stephania cephalantha TaxID=152367 RepID=A0AAP0F0Q8_9MAGN
MTRRDLFRINWDPYVDIRVDDDDDDITEIAFYMRTFMFLSIVEPHLDTESNKTSAEKMADDVLRHMTEKGSNTSATVASGGCEPSRTFHHDSRSTKSDYHTFADDPDPSKRKKRSTNHYKKKRTKANK